ncbi:PREDICTED: protein sel-1 homolog 2-like, partial [Chrysochloris asiatica]|uniref:Protein sel-1 homolog 2-like n=1 Tax=Chrysochloris asiatica TaxID=185453 RepID=A0A9B0X1J4_CHRAS
ALGFLSSYGIGMEYDQAKALIYYTFGSAGGSMISQMILGYRYLSGINVLQNCEVALNHYKTVADYIADKLEKTEGIPVEKVRLTERPENLSSNSEILDWDIYQYYKFLAERGDVQIQVQQQPLSGAHKVDLKVYLPHDSLAECTPVMDFSISMYQEMQTSCMYLEGNAAAPQNNATAFKYFSMAADKISKFGAVSAGSGVWKDYKLAFKYFYLASQSGQPLAVYYLAEMYATGTGVLRSCRTAVEQFHCGGVETRLECVEDYVEGNAFARVKIGDYHYYGYGTKKDYQTAATHYSIAADKYHSAQAMFNLAYMYEHGLGIEKDIHLARRFYDMAAQTSPDAYLPVFFALMKLETVHFLRDILFFDFTMRWKWVKLDNDLGPYWDLFVIGLLAVLLIILLRNRHA